MIADGNHAVRGRWTPRRLWCEVVVMSGRSARAVSPYAADPGRVVGTYTLVSGTPTRPEQVEAFLQDVRGVERAAQSRPVQRPYGDAAVLGRGQSEKVPTSARRATGRERSRERPAR